MQNVLRSLLTLPLAVFLFAGTPSTSFASTLTCEGSFATPLPRTPTVGKEIALRNPLEVGAQTNFGAQWAKLIALSKAKLSARDARDLEEWILTSFFVDRPMVAVRPSKDARDIEWMWSNTGGRPIGNFFTAFRDFVVMPKTSGELQADWKLMHRALMQDTVKIRDVIDRKRSLKDWVVGLVGGNVEGIDSGSVGKFRSVEVYFSAENNRFADYRQNKLLTAGKMEDGSLPVHYPRISDVENFSSLVSPGLRADIKAGKGTAAQLTERLVQELVDWAFATHATRLASAKNLNDRVAAHVELSHNLVSIHPFANGNGRTTRFLLTTLLAKEGLPPAVLRDTWDVGLSVNQYVERVVDGIALTRSFLDDVMVRIENGMDPMESPVLMMALLPSRIYFDPGQAQVGKQFFPVDPYDFAQFTREQKVHDQDERSRFRSYMKHLKSWGVFNATTLQPYQQKLIPNEMVQTFFRVDAVTPAVWKSKKNLFYEGENVYRGLSTRESLTDAQLLEYFVEIQPISLSMKSSGATKAQWEASIKEDFRRYNSLLQDPKAFFQLAKDHMEATGEYPQSPLLSSALDARVADRFARGFLTGDQSILAMKGQLILGAAMPRYGVVELNRLHPVGKHHGIQFVPKYPRQKEVSVAGALSPDSVMTVEFRDVEVKSVGVNTGMPIAGDDTVVKGRRVLTRDPIDPSVIHLTKYDSSNQVVSVDLYQMTRGQNGQIVFVRK